MKTRQITKIISLTLILILFLTNTFAANSTNDKTILNVGIKEYHILSLLKA